MLRQELRQKARAGGWYGIEDSKRLLKEAILARGGEKLKEEVQQVQQAQEQQDQRQQREDEKRAFSEMLEQNSEDWESGTR